MTKFQTQFVLALSILALSSPLMASAHDTTYENTLQVQGQGQVETPPDSLRTQVTVQTEAKTMAEAREQNAKKTNAIINKVKALGFPGLEIQTQYFNANPIHKYEKDGRSKITGYQVNHSLSVKVEEVSTKEKLEEMAGKIADTALNNGATSAGDVNFYLSDNNPVYDKALALAVKQTRKKADVIAEAAGIRVAGVYQIESYSNATPMTEARGGMMKAYAADAVQEETPSPISAGPLKVTASVTIRFDIAD